MSILLSLAQTRNLSPCPSPLLPWWWHKLLPRGGVGKFHGHLSLFQKKKREKDSLSHLVAGNRFASQRISHSHPLSHWKSQSARQSAFLACLPASQNASGLQNGPGFPPVWSHQLKCTNICDLTLNGCDPEEPILEPASSSWKPISPSESARSTSLSGLFFSFFRQLAASFWDGFLEVNFLSCWNVYFKPW